MKTTRRRALTVGLLAVVACTSRPMDQQPAYELTNGLWYTGTGFQSMTMYAVGEQLRTQRPIRVDSVIDLGGGYVVPAFGEAHTHRPGSPNEFEGSAATLLDAGIFYVMNLGNLARYRSAFDSMGTRPGSVDVLFANALIASPKSHGVDLWRRLVGRGVFPGAHIDSLEGDAYFILDSLEALEHKWPAIIQTRPDVIKIMIEYSEEYDVRWDNPAYFGQSGLDPGLVPAIVALAHSAGLRVAAHIETAADFHVAVDAGVDIVAHLPGYDIPADDDVDRYRIAPADAALAAEQGSVVITTTLLSVDRADGDAARLERMLVNHRHNLRLLAQAGVRLAVGSDQYSQNAVDEAMNLASLGVFDSATILHMLCSETPRTIFPERRVGALGDGAEASFLVLRENPLEDLKHIRDIVLRVKDGEPLIRR